MQEDRAEYGHRSASIRRVSGGGIGALLERLEVSRTRRGGGSPSAVIRLLRERALPDASSLLRYHEALLFLRAYPPDAPTLRAAEGELRGFAARVADLERAGADLRPLDGAEVSGVVGTAITTDYSFDVVRWLKRRHPREVHADWTGFEATDRLRALLPSFLPLLDEEALEDANVAYREWLAAAGAKDELAWLIARLEGLAVPEADRAERYEALALPIRWTLSDPRSSRSGQRWPARRTFFHRGPFIERRDVSLEKELSGPPMTARRVSEREGRRILDLAREATALRYREYYNFTYADAARVRRAEVGRGVQIFLCGLRRGRRLPLRAGFAAFLVKNGVPIGYAEALALCERMEVGVNVYYAFREGESAWIFARLLHLLRDTFGVSSFSIDPYQIGLENPEAIASGAFWFYRKLGFRSTDAALRRLTQGEEERIRTAAGYRSPERVLRRFARGSVIYDTPPTAPGAWDDFHIRNIGLAVQRRMASAFGGDADRARRESLGRVARILGIDAMRWPPRAREALASLALVWNLIPDLTQWTRAEKDGLAAVARAKSGPDEALYLRRTQRHGRLRDAMRELGRA